MVKPSLEKVASGKKNDLFEFSWPVDQNLSLSDAYSLAYKFGESIDNRAKKLRSHSRKSLIGVIIYNSEGEPFVAQDPGDLQTYSSWKIIEEYTKDLAQIDGKPVGELVSFWIGFKHVDVVYELKKLIELAEPGIYPHFGGFKVASCVNIKNELEQFVNSVSPNTDLSELNKLTNYRLKSLK